MRSLIAAIALLGARSSAVPLTARGAPSVDLGYAVYDGTLDSQNGINIFKGIRYAAPPVGNLRFAAPQPPKENRTAPISATIDGPACPQTGAGKDTPAAYGFISALGNEDCLYLNVYAPSNATNLPVFFWIHGGGYGLFSAQGLDPTEFMKTNGNGFISVIIQYRLGAFGFLSSEDVKSDGALNAGLLDMNFALKWVQRHIKSFGGDPARVTIAGESAGGAAVMYQAMAYGATQNVSLFNNIIAESPWVPAQHNYDDEVPTQAYEDFAEAAGCANATETLQCLRNSDSEVLQNASAKVSEASAFGSFAFLPVTDGCFVQDLPSTQLVSKSLSGRRLLSGNLANEGVPLSPPNTTTLEDFRDYVSLTFPSFSADDKAELEDIYSYEGDDQDVDPSAPVYDTDGIALITAVNQSTFGTGQQQRVFNVFAESTFVCPSYWLASAFPQAWKYQFSANPAYHGFDLQALWSGTTTPGASFKHAFRKIWGNFIIHDDPAISVSDAKGGVAASTVPEGADGLMDWPVWTDKMPVLLNLNTTGGNATYHPVTEYLKYYTYSDPGVVNVITVADADAWEGGRGERCKWWLEHAESVPY
ncbi:alpha/beta-hydrolase [Paraphaeosphaeria sporulosa]|uniref:Carboxylic ester hydrolase n=1 Tax=Paraphaeosphaeria sporulosa TaxID=1460663 RepID=A0A177CVL9_9PLEO|nr:alpha/beta-hydrolase [Paraphaeosphaeria sporulosa]OAG10910.1 alpha/beta-hydrolase [Paraphaeosphaeria sporulosa]